MIGKALQLLADRKDLDRETMVATMNQIMEGAATPAQIGAFLMGLRQKGETVIEITGAAQVMREKSLKIKAPPGCIDTCGTGGDGKGTFNISTASALVAAGAGLCVAKHGNRAASSACGSADVLSALGVNIEATPATVEQSLREAGIGFLFAPALHQAMRHAIGPRKEMAVRTIFNVLGPLTNPAGARRQLLGVFSPALTETLARALAGLGAEAALVVHGLDGIDELSPVGFTQVSELKNGAVTTYQVRPHDVGLAPCRPEDLKGGDATKNAQILRGVLANQPGPARDAVALNAGAAIYVGGAANSLKQGVTLALETIAQGRAQDRLERLIKITNA